MRSDRESPGSRLILGDCLAGLRELGSSTVDAIVTDPPAGIGFMGKKWDKPGILGVSGGVAMPVTTSSRNPSCRICGGRMRAGASTKACSCPSPDWNDREYVRKDRDKFVDFLGERLAEAYRVAKPGSYALVWGLPRTSHWTGLAIEEAGWTVRDRITHLFGTGFPKAKSCLKPGAEDWWVAYKPTRSGRMMPLQIERSRVDSIRTDTRIGSCKHMRSGNYGNGSGKPTQPTIRHTNAGRWPANVCLSHHPDCRPIGPKRIRGDKRPGGLGSRPGGFGNVGSGSGKPGPCGKLYGDAEGLETVDAWSCHPDCAIGLLDRQSGQRPGAVSNGNRKGNGYGGGFGRIDQKPGYGDHGGASRFFYCAKASRADRGEGNTHPTVKSTELMRWLLRIVTPPGGEVLDLFAGSGSTLKAALLEGFSAIGFEDDPHSHRIATRRLATVRSQLLRESEAA